MPFQADATLGPYRIVNLLGEGGMGAVYRAKDTRLGRDVAVKVLTAVTLSDTERLQRFEQEARATGMLNHPNLLTVYDVGNDHGTPYLVTELLEGETLRDRIARGPIPPRKAIDAAAQMAQGLAAAHEKGVVHRDLKPDNIFITREGRVKILDFGIAKLSPNAHGGDGPAFQMAATEPGMVLGTVGYMSPEQVRGEVVDQRSDIFSFGTILYEMLTGQRAFRRNSSIETLSAILREDPPDLSEQLPNIPPALEKLVRRCLEKDRERRFQSARDLAFSLEAMSSMSMPGTLSNMPMPTGSSTAPTTRTAAPTTAAPPPTMRTAAPSAARPTRTVIAPRKPKRRASTVLVSALFVVAICGATYGGWWYATQSAVAKGEVVFHRMTFRRGEVRAARFTPDGDGIVYSAAWDGQPSAIFVASRQSPEARPLGVTDADVLAVSKSTEVALLLHRDRLTGTGTLARVPLAGGTPREVADAVVQADWLPDGSNLAAIRIRNGKFRIEAPVGTPIYETPHVLSDVRVSPDGTRIAFFETINGQPTVSVMPIKAATPESIVAGWQHGANGLAWQPDGKGLWVTGTSTGAPPSLYAVTLDGDVRLLERLTGSMKLFDISPAGRALLSNGMWRAALEYQAPGDTAERDVSWLDWSIASDLSPDGRTLLFNELREGGGDANAVYVRRLDAQAPVRIGDAAGDALSPDGKWVLAHKGAKLVLLPTGTGEPRELKVQGTFDPGAAWFPDSRRVVVGGMSNNDAYQLHVIDTLDETAKAITPQGVWGDVARPFAVSPDGRWVAGMTAQQTMALYSVDGSSQPVPIAAAEQGEVPITFSNDGQLLYVCHPTAVPAQITRINLATGAREPWKTFAPADPAGVYKVFPIFITPDGSAYAYDALRTLSDLYVVEGLK